MFTFTFIVMSKNWRSWIKCIRTSFGLIDDIIVFLIQYLLVATPINPKLLRKTKPFFKIQFSSIWLWFAITLHQLYEPLFSKNLEIDENHYYFFGCCEEICRIKMTQRHFKPMKTVLNCQFPQHMFSICCIYQIEIAKFTLVFLIYNFHNFSSHTAL